jgi:hypothetical protein
MSLESKKDGPSLPSAYGPTGPMTLHQKVLISNAAVSAMKRVSHGQGFIPPGSIEKTKRETDDVRARLDLLLEVHPGLGTLYEQHEQLLNAYYNPANDKNRENLAEQCSALGEQIVALEQSVDLG